MQIVYGKDCTLTVFQNNTYTPIPYCTETLRSSALVYSLAETVGNRKRVVNRKYGSEIAGCFVTRLTNDCIIPLFKIVTDPGCSFSIYMDRVVEQVIYFNVRMLSFELKADLDDAVYLKVEIEGTRHSYVSKNTLTFTNLKWDKTPTLFFHKEMLLNNSEIISSVYKFSFKCIYSGIGSYTLQLHAPLQIDSLLSNDDILTKVLLSLNNQYKIRFNTLEPVNDFIETDTCGELLVIRKYRIIYDITFDFRSDSEYWSKTL